MIQDDPRWSKMRVPRNQIRIQFGDLATRRLNRQGKLCICHFSVYLGVSWWRLQRGPNLATLGADGTRFWSQDWHKKSTNQRNRKGIAYQQICFRTLGYLPQTPSAMQKRFHRHSKRHWRGWCRYLKTAIRQQVQCVTNLAIIHKLPLPCVLKGEVLSSCKLQVLMRPESKT